MIPLDLLPRRCPVCHDDTIIGFGPSLSIIVRYPGGSRSLAPSHGLSGWSSHTQRAPPQTSHSDVSISPRPLFILIPQALEFQVARAHSRRYEATGLAEGANLAKRQWRNNSGAYAILERGDPYVSVTNGSVSNVIGLPMETLTQVLHWLRCQETA